MEPSHLQTNGKIVDMITALSRMRLLRLTTGETMCGSFGVKCRSFLHLVIDGAEEMVGGDQCTTCQGGLGCI